MKSFIKKVPNGIRYLSDWRDFNFEVFPPKCIVNKQIPGCGYTHWAITCPYPVIVTSPRKMLLKNKKDQHPEVFLVMTEEDKDLYVDKDLSSKAKKTKVTESPATSKKKSRKVSSKKSKSFRLNLYKELKEYLDIFSIYDQMPRSNPLKKYPKILVTYDSYYIVKGILKDLGQFHRFYTVVDEMQAILSDARFKSTTEMKFMEALEDVDKVQFISATPILGKYLEMLDEFKNIPYCELDWKTLDPSRVKKPEFEGILTMRSVSEKLCENIEKYKRGEFVSRYIINEDGTRSIIESKEAVFYVNSVKHIINAISKCELKPSEVNILCSDTPENRRNIRKSIGSSFKIGSVPLKGEPRKMFTFCTRTVYLGADFYSDCARSFVFSDSNSDCLAVDISQDLPQIFGRQRLVENPWKNCATLYYRSMADYKKMTESDFQKNLSIKKKKTQDLISIYSRASSDEKITLIEKFERDATLSHYKYDYLSVTNGSAVFNNYAYVAEVRSFDIQQKDYADRFTVFSNLKKISDSNRNIDLISEFLKIYQGITGETWKRLQMVCKFYYEHGKEVTEGLLNNLQDVDPVKEIFLVAGPDLCKACSYHISEVKRGLGKQKFTETELRSFILSEFKVGEIYTKSNLKKKLQDIFNLAGYSIKAKAVTINNWFDTLETTFPGDNGSRFHGIRIEAIKVNN